MPFIELTLFHNNKPILVNTANISSVSVMHDRPGTMVSMGERADQFLRVTECYAELKRLIANAEKA